MSGASGGTLGPGDTSEYGLFFPSFLFELFWTAVSRGGSTEVGFSAGFGRTRFSVDWVELCETSDTDSCSTGGKGIGTCLFFLVFWGDEGGVVTFIEDGLAAAVVSVVGLVLLELGGSGARGVLIMLFSGAGGGTFGGERCAGKAGTLKVASGTLPGDCVGVFEGEAAVVFAVVTSARS